MMFWTWGRNKCKVEVAKIIEEKAEFSTGEVRECFAVDPETTLLLKGVLAVLLKEAELAWKDLMDIRSTNEERAYHAGELNALTEVLWMIKGNVKNANVAKRGLKPDDGCRTG